MRHLISCCLLLLLAACSNDADITSDTDSFPVAVPPTDPLSFEDYRYDDSTALRDHGPFFTYHLQTLRAQGGSEALRRVINDTLSARLFGFVASDNLPLDTAVRAYVNPLFADYTEQDIQEEWLQEAPQSFSREQDERTEVLFRGDSLIVLAHLYYEYTGGAHGMHFTTLLPFSVEPPALLTYDDFFPAGVEDRLRELLMAKAMEDPERIFGDSIPVTRNVAPLPDGVRFLYDPYAIGPYASGEIALDLPYAELSGILRPGVAEWVRQ
ncbi:DUF3298 and DUF4163 domain-containing protein [Lewinella sp. IMCC34191]|uniref:DUF3298 and DUF4163 domain-containing protein n=1 Tax=Lewinella sp. IMCC34191 TaxID=2259172 RepID=UPI000E25C16E|nr:DUF3298 and DUF4163 domain-containing protein [Lewinella sp. IMCC34191]